jgi:hypothetical protein
MAGRAQRFVNSISAHITIWQALGLGGVVSSLGIGAWAAAASGWFAEYGPIAIWAAGLGSAFIAAVGLFLIARTRAIFQIIRFRNRVADKAAINPLESVFRNQRIYIRDLSPPIGILFRAKLSLRAS